MSDAAKVVVAIGVEVVVTVIAICSVNVVNVVDVIVVVGAVTVVVMVVDAVVGIVKGSMINIVVDFDVEGIEVSKYSTVDPSDFSGPSKLLVLS